MWGLRINAGNIDEYQIQDILGSMGNDQHLFLQREYDTWFMRKHIQCMGISDTILQCKAVHITVKILFYIFLPLKQLYKLFLG